MKLGGCSLCGGCVCVPDLWWGVHAPVPTCCACKATPAGRSVIEMIPAVAETSDGFCMECVRLTSGRCWRHGTRVVE